MRLNAWRRVWIRRVLAAAGLTLGAGLVLTIVISGAEDRWWRDYGGSPDNSRYVASTTIDRKNVGTLAVAWTYPYGDAMAQSDRGSQCDLRPRPQRRRRRARRPDRQGDLDPRRHAGDVGAGHELLGKQGRKGSPPHLHDERLPAGDRRGDRAVDQDVRHRRASSICARASERDPATIGRIQSGTPGKIFENLIMLGSATGEGYMSAPGDLRAYDVITGKLVVAVPHDSAARRVRLRDLAEGRVEVHRRHQHVGRDYRRRRARHRLLPHRLAHLRLLRRRSHRRAISSATACSRSTRARASGSGTSRPSTTTSGTSTTTRRRSSRASSTTARTSTSSRWRARQDSSTSSIASPARRSGRSRNVPCRRATMPGEESWPTQPFPTKPPPFAQADVHRRRHQSLSDRQRQRARDDTSARRRRAEHGAVHADRLRRHGARSRRQRRRALRLHRCGSNGQRLRGRSERSWRVEADAAAAAAGYRIAGPRRLSARLPGMPRGRSQRHTGGADARDARGTRGRCSIARDDRHGKGRMPAFPHITDVEMDALVTFLLAPAARWWRPRTRHGDRSPPFPAGPVVATGGAQTRPPGGGRGRGARAYPEGVEQRPQ